LLRAFQKKIGGDLLSHTVTHAVPSALKSLTSVFGMGTGDPLRYGHRKIGIFYNYPVFLFCQVRRHSAIPHPAKLDKYL
jgi:hypothetical protein